MQKCAWFRSKSAKALLGVDLSKSAKVVHLPGGGDDLPPPRSSVCAAGKSAKVVSVWRANLQKYGVQQGDERGRGGEVVAPSAKVLPFRGSKSAKVLPFRGRSKSAKVVHVPYVKDPPEEATAE